MNLPNLKLIFGQSLERSQRICPTIKTSGYQLLLLDDSTTVLNVMSQILRRIPGLFLTVECSPYRALEILERDSGSFDLVLTDIRMPLMDGIEFAAHVKQLRPELPILAITSVPSAVDNKPDFAGVVPKPFSPEELIAGVIEFLEESATTSHTASKLSLPSLGTPQRTQSL
ncbi:MAG: response regulator [Limisphaerales bacterium]